MKATKKPADLVKRVQTIALKKDAGNNETASDRVTSSARSL